MPDLARTLLLRLALVASALWLAGCQAGYYLHLARGHLALMNAAQPVADLLEQPQTDPELRRRLVLTRQVLAFAESEMGLPAEHSYRDFVALDRDHVVWNLVAAEEFSLTPRQWCYPVVGCASYRGFFDQSRADAFAEALRAEGLEVYGAGAIAYSTLGWLDDPLTSAMLAGSDAWIVALLVHELVHRRLYVKGDTLFNESLATAVAAEARRRWLARHADEQAGRQWRVHDQAAARVDGWIARARSELEAIYASGLDDGEKRQRKQEVVAALRDRFDSAVAADPSLSPWQAWFAGPLNNAQLALRQDYNGAVPRFNALLLACGGRLDCFWNKVEHVAGLSQAQRQAWMEQRND